MNELYVPEDAINRVPGGPDPVWRPATRTEILFATGLASVCETCGGEGHKADKRTDGNWTDGVCDWCDGRGWLLDPDRLEAAAKANWYEWHKGHPGGFKGAMEDMAEAALLAYTE